MKIQPVKFTTKKYGTNFGNQDTYEKGYKRGVRLGQFNAINGCKPNIEPQSTPNYKNKENKLDYIIGYNDGYQKGYENPFESIIPHKAKKDGEAWEEPTRDSAELESQADKNNARLHEALKAEEKARRAYVLAKNTLLCTLPVTSSLEEAEPFTWIGRPNKYPIADDDE